MQAMVICGVIKGNESLVQNLNFYFLTPLSYNFEILHFDANPILTQTPLQLDIWLQSYEGFVDAKTIKTKEFDNCFCQYLKNNPRHPTHSS